MQKRFWKGKRVLITGYEGFLGSNLTKRLLRLGPKISGLDTATRRKETILTQKELRTINIVKGSVENRALVDRIVKKNKIEIIFHLAAEALVGECFNNPAEGFSTNIKGTWNVLEASRLNKSIKAIIVASSDKAYGSHSKLPYKENASLSGRHPYDVSKSCADLITHTYFHSYRAPVAITRCGNIFGPGDFNFSRIVPDCFRSIVKNKILSIRSDGKFTRDYVFIDDIVNGYITLAEKMKVLELYGEAFNFSDENPISVLNLVKKVYQISGKRPNYRVLNKAKYEIKKQYLSSVKARKILGWKAKNNLEQGLKKTFDWYKGYLTK